MMPQTMWRPSAPTYHGTMTRTGDVVDPGGSQPAPWVFDLLLGLAVTLTVSLFIVADVDETQPDGRAFLWAIGLGALMLARRRYPVIVVVLSAGAVIAYHAAGYPPIGIAIPLAAAVFSAAEFGRVAAATAASAIVLVISVVYRLVVDGQVPGFVLGYDLPHHAVLLGGAIAFGDSVRTRREVRRQSAEIAELTADRYRREAEQRVMTERLAMARELHDSVGHALTVITLHTQVVEELVDCDDLEVRRSLAAIADTTAATFADLRRTVATLRKGVEPSRSTLRLADLESAVLPARQAGLTVATNVDVRSHLPASIEAAVYRIVQESITNVVRHADASRVDVAVEETNGAVQVTVSDDGAAASDPSDTAGEGNGVAGMRERTQLLGGTFFAGREDGGFVVRVSIPLEVRS